MCYSFQWRPFDHRALVQIKNIYSPTSRLFSWLKSSTLHCVCVHMQTGALVYASDNYCHCHACLMAPWDTNELSPLLPTQHSLEHMGRLEVEGRNGWSWSCPLKSELWICIKARNNRETRQSERHRACQRSASTRYGGACLYSQYLVGETGGSGGQVRQFWVIRDPV